MANGHFHCHQTPEVQFILKGLNVSINRVGTDPKHNYCKKKKKKGSI